MSGPLIPRATLVKRLTTKATAKRIELITGLTSK